MSSFLRSVRAAPFNAEADPARLGDPITPLADLYVRAHFATPEPATLPVAVTLGGQVLMPLTLTLDEVRRRASHTVVATMECAGNGRVNYQPLPPGEPWQGGAVGTAVWQGVSLRDLLLEAQPLPGAGQVVAFGADQGQPEDAPASFHYGRSLPLDKALHPDTLLAVTLNGVPLPLEHGGPVRLVVPGWYGMASVKWLTHLVVQADPFDGYYQAARYVYDDGASGHREPVTTIRVKALVTTPGDEALAVGAPAVVQG